MTAITFPTDPANGELYTAPNGAVYIWDGEKWMVNSTTYTGTALTEITQDRVHSMFTHGENVGISFSYNDSTDKLIATVSGGGGGLSITDFGRGFVDTKDSGKITTNKLYNRPDNLALNNHYELSVTNGGVVALPDGSIINGATLKTVPGNYAGITAGPASPAGKDEDSWVWVDNDGATISTKYSTSNFQWKFDNNGATTFPTLTVPISDNTTPNGTGQTIKFSDSSQQAIIFGPEALSLSNPSAQRVIIQGAPGFTGTTGEGGDVYLWAGPGGSLNGSGGDIKVRAGYGNGLGTGGYLNFQAGDSLTGDGGWIRIESGETGTYGQGGDIEVQARSGGEVYLRTYTSDGTPNEWLFDNNGDLNIAAGGTIRDPVTGNDLLRYYDPDDTDHWNEPTVNTIQAALDELAARVTALQNYEIDGGNAYTPAVGELLIDGNGD